MGKQVKKVIKIITIIFWVFMYKNKEKLNIYFRYLI